MTNSNAIANTLAEHLNANRHSSMTSSIMRHHEVMHPMDVNVRTSHVHSLKVADYNESITNFCCFYILNLENILIFVKIACPM